MSMKFGDYGSFLESFRWCHDREGQAGNKKGRGLGPRPNQAIRLKLIRMDYFRRIIFLVLWNSPASIL